MRWREPARTPVTVRGERERRERAAPRDVDERLVPCAGAAREPDFDPRDELGIAPRRLRAERLIDAREPLMRLLMALGQEPIDVSWLSSANGIDVLDTIASDLSLTAEWDQLPATFNPVRLRQQLAGRVQSIWLAIANDRMSRSEARLARMALRLHIMGGAMA